MGRYPQMRRRSVTASAIAVRRMRWARLVTPPSPGEPRARRASARRRPGALPLHVRFGVRQRIRTARSHRRDGRSTIGDTRATLRPTRGGHAGEQPRQTGTSRRERIAAAKLNELAAEARAGWDATILERLIVKGLARYYYGIDTETRRALAAAEPPLTGTVWDAVIAATVEHACTTHGAEVPAWT